MSGSRVIELGAGVGLCSIVASICQAKSVIVTDGDHTSIKLTQENVDRNKL